MKVRKLFLATETLNNSAMFISYSDSIDALEKQAKEFLDKELRNNFSSNKTFSVKEVTNISQAPIEWREKCALLWGTDEEITVSGYFDTQAEEAAEFQEYLRLKAKYE
jgi:hypothetical protein